ncbi:MAG TPA: NAD(P)-dependent oxidoreductase, partial [Erythrobacter sp.]|nr:NAD(P)-dependent oxidoreductase [Erythrobacter sp.]
MERDLALIGFGEAGSTFCAAARWAKPACAFDPDPSRKQAIEEAGISAS